MTDQYNNYYAGKTVVITGGAGFIGSNLAMELVRLGASVSLIDNMMTGHGGNLANLSAIRDLVTLNVSDVRDEMSLEYFIRNGDVVFNLAGQTSHMDSMADPFTDLKINTEAQISLLESCRRHNPSARIVFASTRQIYGRPSELPVTEEHRLEPVDANGINKMAGEWYHVLYHRVYGLKTTSLRLTNTYGPRMRIKDARQTFLGIWIKSTVQHGEFEVWGGEQLRDYNYVTDVTHAFLLAAAEDAAIGKIYNLGHHEVVSLAETAKALVGVAKTGTYRVCPFPKERKSIDIGSFYSSYEKIKSELGWVPRVKLSEGLSRTLDYYADGGLERYL